MSRGAAPVGRQQPFVVARQVEGCRVDEALEVLRVHHGALHRVVGLVVVDRLEPGVDLVDGAGRGAGGDEARVVVVRGAGRGRHRLVGLPAEQRAVVGIGREQVAERGGAAAGHTDQDQRRRHRGGGQARMGAVPLPDAQPVGQVHPHLRLECQDADLVEVGFLGARRPQRVETVAERRVAVVVEADRGRHLLQQTVDVHQIPSRVPRARELGGIRGRGHEEELVGAGVASVVDRARAAHRA